LYVASANGSSITRYSADGVEEQTFSVALPDAGGTWTPMAFGKTAI
jgi:hypothetical protein